MQVVKTVGEYKVIKKRSGRYGVLAKGRKWVSGDDKVRILDEAGLIQAPAPKAAVEEAPEPVVEEATAAAAEDPVEEAPGEEAAETEAGDPEKEEKGE